MVVADRIDAHAHFAAVVPESLHFRFPAEHPQQRGTKVAQVAIGVEADHVCAQHSFEELGPVRQHSEDLA